MTTWCTPSDVLDRYRDHQLIADLATPRDLPRVAGVLLRLVVEGGAVVEYPIQEQEAAAEALAAVEDACRDAGDLVDTYLAARWPGGMDPVPGVVRGAAVDLAAEILLGERDAPQGSPYAGILRRAKGARDILTGLRDGKLTLGAESGADAAPAGVRYSTAERLLTMDSLAGMG